MSSEPPVSDLVVAPQRLDGRTALVTGGAWEASDATAFVTGQAIFLDGGGSF